MKLGIKEQVRKTDSRDVLNNATSQNNVMVTCLKDKLEDIGYIVKYESKEKIEEFIISI